LEWETNTGEKTDSDECRKCVKVQKKRCEGGILTSVRERKGMMIGWKSDRKETPEKEEELLSPSKSDGRRAYLNFLNKPFMKEGNTVQKNFLFPLIKLRYFT
jgi:hypothetical protein